MTIKKKHRSSVFDFQDHDENVHLHLKSGRMTTSGNEDEGYTSSAGSSPLRDYCRPSPRQQPADFSELNEEEIERLLSEEERVSSPWLEKVSKTENPDQKKHLLEHSASAGVTNSLSLPKPRPTTVHGTDTHLPELNGLISESAVPLPWRNEKDPVSGPIWVEKYFDPTQRLSSSSPVPVDPLRRLRNTEADAVYPSQRLINPTADVVVPEHCVRESMDTAMVGAESVKVESFSFTQTTLTENRSRQRANLSEISKLTKRQKVESNENSASLISDTKPLECPVKESVLKPELPVIPFDLTEESQTAVSSVVTWMTNFERLSGVHVTQRVIHRSSKGLKKATKSMKEVLDRNFVDQFQNGDSLVVLSRDEDREKRRIAQFMSMDKHRARTLAKCGSVFKGVALSKKKLELAKNRALTKKQRNNLFTSVQRCDKSSSCAKFLSEFAADYGLKDKEMSTNIEIENACRVACIFLDRHGFITSISPNLIREEFEIVVFLKAEVLYLVTNFRGLCRVDLYER